MKNREHIIETALAMFNQQGTAAVTTNHIAAAAGISPGNLYYHFKNKEEIIRAIFERLYARWDTAFGLPQDRPPQVQDVEALVRVNFAILQEYRFVYREMIALLQNDPELHSSFVAVRARGYEGFHDLFRALVQGGILNVPADADGITRVADLCWLISEFWLSMIEVSGQTVDNTQMERGIALMIQVLQPYMTR